MIKIHKEVYGQGQPIVLIHGWAMHTGIWRTFAQQLALNYQVICLDFPGHGLSETVEPYTLEQVTDTLVAAIPESTFTVLGWSLGATVALDLAYRYPQRVNGLIMLAGNPHFVKTEDWPGMSPALLEEFANNLSLDCQATLIRFLSLQVMRLAEGKSLLKQLKQAVQECPSPSKNVLHSALGILKHTDLREQLTTLECSLSIIQGDKDTLVPVQASLAMHKILKNSELNIIPSAGHLPFMSHQSQVIEIIKRFI